MLVVMKNLTSIAPLTIIRKSASGLAVEAVTAQAEKMMCLRRNFPIGGVWLPLSQVVIKDRKVVAVSSWLIKAKNLERLPAGEVGVW
jgi:hypothetical protein